MYSGIYFIEVFWVFFSAIWLAHRQLWAIIKEGEGILHQILKRVTFHLVLKHVGYQKVLIGMGHLQDANFAIFWPLFWKVTYSTKQQQKNVPSEVQVKYFMFHRNAMFLYWDFQVFVFLTIPNLWCHDEY